MKKTRNVVITILLFTCGAGLLIWAAADAQWVQTVSAQDVLDNPAAFRSKTLQVFGKVVPGSIKEQVRGSEFELYWPREHGTEDGGQKTEEASRTLHVKYTGLSKVNLQGDSDVLIDCRVNEEGQIAASRILTKCPSKYKSSKP